GRLGNASIRRGRADRSQTGTRSGASPRTIIGGIAKTTAPAPVGGGRFLLVGGGVQQRPVRGRRRNDGDVTPRADRVHPPVRQRHGGSRDRVRGRVGIAREEVVDAGGQGDEGAGVLVRHRGRDNDR